MYAETRRSNPIMPLFILVALAAIAFVTISQLSGAWLNPHALAHSTAQEIRNCPKDKLGAILLNPVTGRHAFLCEFRPGQWGRHIVEQNGDSIEEVTSFAGRPAMNTIGKAIANLVRAGYTNIEYITPVVAEAAAKALAE